MGKKGDVFPVRTLDECWASLETALSRYETADGRGQVSLAKVLAAVAEAALRLDERDPERLRRYLAALLAADALRVQLDALPALAVARARLHAGGPATVVARGEGSSFSPVTYRLADATAPEAPFAESEQQAQIRSGVCAQVRFNHGGRFAVELFRTTSLAFDLPPPAAMSAPHAVHAPSGRLVLDGGRDEPDATLVVPPGWYDAVFSTFDGERRVVVLLAPTPRRGNDPARVDVLATRGLEGGS